jgi:hypothetical protein
MIPLALTAITFFAIGFVASFLTCTSLAHRRALNLRIHTWRAAR